MQNIVLEVLFIKSIDNLDKSDKLVDKSDKNLDKLVDNSDKSDKNLDKSTDSFKSLFDIQSNVIESELKSVSSFKNYTESVRLLLNAIDETDSRFGATVPIDYLLKKTNKKLELIKKGPTYGLGLSIDKSVDYWTTLHKFIRTKNLLKEEKISKLMTIYKLTDEAVLFKNDKSIRLPDWSIT